MMIKRIFINIKIDTETKINRMKNKYVINNLLLLFDQNSYYPFDEIHVAKYIIWYNHFSMMMKRIFINIYNDTWIKIKKQIK